MLLDYYKLVEQPFGVTPTRASCTWDRSTGKRSPLWSTARKAIGVSWR